MKTKSLSQAECAFRSQTRRRWDCYTSLLLAAIGLVLLLQAVSPAQADDRLSSFLDDVLFVSPDAKSTKSLAWGDADGDGDLDLAVGNWGQANQLYRNDGHGSFSVEDIGTPISNTASVAWGDADGDGDLDLAVGNEGQVNQFYRNDGSGNFTAEDIGSAAQSSPAMAWGDADGDGDLDLAVGGAWLYRNDGSGGFTVTDTGTLSDTRSVAWGDADGDGDLDLAVGNWGQVNLLLRNDGYGNFVPQDIGTSISTTVSVIWGDADGDGDLDLAIGNEGQVNQLCRNDGRGNFATENLGTFADKTKEVVWADADGDGDLDLTVDNWWNQPSRLYRNDGTGSFAPEDLVTDQYAYSLAWGDADGDGNLDLAVGNIGIGNAGLVNQIYRNDEGGGLAPEDLESPSVNYVHSLAWGDADGDGDLDLAVGNRSGSVNHLYRNNGGGGFNLEVVGPAHSTYSVAWGDADGDGDLDLAVGNWSQANRLYRNDGHGSFIAESLGTFADLTQSVAWGDADGDGDLDLAVGSYGVTNQLYRNHGDGTFDAEYIGSSAPDTRSVAWGDADGDGDLDLAVGNEGQANQLYRNEGSGSFTAEDVGGVAQDTYSVAWGDADGDGDLDLAVGNYGQANQLYRNDGSGNFAVENVGGPVQDTYSVAWGDADGDGDLDLAVGNAGFFGGINQLYRNDGSGDFTVESLETDTSVTYDVAWGDADGDGDLDLAVGSYGQANQLYRNARQGERALPNNATSLDITTPYTTCSADFYASPQILDSLTIPITYTLFDPEGDPVGCIAAYYSLDGGGQWAPAVPTNTQTTHLSTSLPVHHASGNTFPITISAASNPVTSTLIVFGNQAVADVDVWLNVTHTHDSDLDVYLESPEGTPVELFTGVGGSGHGFFGTILDDEAATPIISGTAPFTRTYQPEGSLADFDGERATGAWTLWVTDTVPISGDGAILSWGVNLRAGDGSHVFVWDTFASGVFGQSDNTVFRLEAYPQPAHASITGTYHYSNTISGPYQWPYAAAAAFPFRVRGTQVRVYSGTVAPGNEVAGAIVYRLPSGQSRGGEPLGGTVEPFHTDIRGYLHGHGRVDVGDRLVALLPISATDSYTLYFTSATPVSTGLAAHLVESPGVQTLTVSSAHPLLLFNLDVSLQWDARTDEAFMSRLQFDLLRASEILYDWTNGQAALGQVRVYHDRERWLDAHIRVYSSNRLRPNAAQGGVISTVITSPVTYEPGQVHMGAIWNRYGDPGASLGEDWPRALAHELGHYAFFLDDNYLGLDESGLLIPVEGCPGAMSDPYREDYPYDEFHAQDGWLPACEQTLSHQSTGRSDWETITAFYPWLSGVVTNTGPSGLPLAVTQIQVLEPVTPPTALENPTFYLSQDGHRVQPGLSAQAFLFQGDWLADLGRPTLDQVLARGARPGDQVCVYELAAGRLGCETVAEGDEQLDLSVADWQPDVIVSPVTSRTIAVSVTNVPAGLSLGARLFPVTDPATGAIVLTETAGEYAGTLHADEPALEGYVHVWVNEAAPRREIVTGYALGGDPAHARGRLAHARGRLAHARGRLAPAVSADGQVILFGDLDFEGGEFVTLQAATVIPSPLPWATVVGQAFRLSASANAQDLSGASISFGYMGSEVPPGEEAWLRVYFWDGSSWEQLPTRLDVYHNAASAAVQGEGLYALMSSLELPLYGPGWNVFSYSAQATQPVTEALLSVSGYYTTVYGYEGQDAMDPWKIYDVTVPDWVNDLWVLEFGHGYWIQVSEAITLMLKGGSASALAMASGLQSPPATYYGEVEAGPGFTPMAGMEVTAWVGSNLCGRGEMLEVDDQVVYSVNVFAAGLGDATGCGAPDREVTFRVGAQDMIPTATWDNSRVWELALQPIHRAYLPLVFRTF